MELAGKHVVVTGGSSGIGRALCRRFAAEGARQIVVADIQAEAAAEVAKEIGGLAIACDVGDEDQVQRLVSEAESAGGPIDLFCSNAGIAVPGLLDTTNEEWQRIWDINVMAHVFAARAVIPAMIERGGGYLLNTASAAGLLSQIGSPSYSTTKHAAVGLAESLAITYGDQGIKVSILCPQAVRTAMTAVPDDEQPGLANIAASADGMMEPEEVAEAVVAGLRDERFLILPHPEVETYFQRKVSDYDRWLSGMRRLQSRLLSS